MRVSLDRSLPLPRLLLRPLLVAGPVPAAHVVPKAAPFHPSSMKQRAGHVASHPRRPSRLGKVQ
jgi:hypothetical protein